MLDPFVRSATGKWIPVKDQCKTCSGKRTITTERALDVHLEKGMKTGDKITFREQGDEIPGLTPGDIIFIVKTNEHGFLERQGCDLLMEKEITLLQALTGVNFTVPHLDGAKLHVTSTEGEVSPRHNVLTFAYMFYVFYLHFFIGSSTR